MEDIGEEIVVGPRVSVEDKCRSEGGGTRIARVHDVFGAPSERVHDVLEHPAITNTSSGCSYVMRIVPQEQQELSPGSVRCTVAIDEW